MGADLYINKLYDENYEKTKPLFDEAVKQRNMFNATIPAEVMQAATDKAWEKPLTPRQMQLLEEHRLTLEHSDKLQEEVSKQYEAMHAVGYFRDSYNDSSLFWKLGLSWWGMSREKSYINSRGNIPPEAARRLRARIMKMPAIKITQADLARWDKKETVESVQEYFDKKRIKFIAFLDAAIKAKRTIRASI